MCVLVGVRVRRLAERRREYQLFFQFQFYNLHMLTVKIKALGKASLKELQLNVEITHGNNQVPNLLGRSLYRR